MKFLKNKNKNMFSKINQILLIIASILLIILIVIIDSKSEDKLKDKFKINRQLFSTEEKQKIEDICQKANKHLMVLYQSDSFFHINDNLSLEKPTLYLLNYLEKNSGKDLKNFIFSFYAEIILVILDLALIILWIILCRYVANENYMQCLLKFKCANELLKNICFVISIFMYVTIILLNIIILFYFSVVFQDINNAFCSLFKISYHTYYGEENFYEIRPKWAGIKEINNILEKTKNKLNLLTDQNSEIEYKINEIKKNKYYTPENTNFINNHINNICDLYQYKVPNPNPLNDKEISEFLYCSDLLSLAEQEYKEDYYPSILKLTDISLDMNLIKKDMDKIEFSLKNAINKLDSYTKIIKDKDILYFNKLVYIFEKVIHGYLIYILYIFFILIVLLELFAFVNIIFLKCCFSNYCNRLYNIVWNVQFFSSMIILLLVAFISTIRIILKDLGSIMKYSCEKNELDDNLTVFNNGYDIESINICFFGDGNLVNYLGLDKEAQILNHFYSNINYINNNLNYYKNYKKISEKNETLNLFQNLEENPFLVEYLLDGSDNITNPEEMLEYNLNKYTTDEKYQICNDNKCYANYFFVYDESFCKENYNFIQNNEINDNNINGQNCMLLKDFPDLDITNYFKTITIKDMDGKIGYKYYLDELINKFKDRYYNNNNGFEKKFLNLLQSSKDYLDNEISVESSKFANSIRDIYEIIYNKINILHEIYQNILEEKSPDLFSAFNCKYLHRDFYIFIDQIETNLNNSLDKIYVICFAIGICSFISIIYSILVIKLIKITKHTSNYLPNEKIDKDDLTEKVKNDVFHEKFNFDENFRSSTKEVDGFKKVKKQKT